MAMGAQVVQKTDDMAIVSLILGILSMLMFSIFAGIPAVILGHKSRGRIKRSMGALTGDGIALAGLIMGYLSFLAIPFVLIIAAIAIPNLLRARIAANEASAIGSVRTINVAQVSYATNHQEEGFTLLSCGPGERWSLGLNAGERNEIRLSVRVGRLRRNTGAALHDPGHADDTGNPVDNGPSAPTKAPSSNRWRGMRPETAWMWVSRFEGAFATEQEQSFSVI